MIVIGSKPYVNIKMNPIIDSFSKNIRCNMALPCNNNGTLLSEHIMNCHVYENFMYRRDINQIIKQYNNTISEDYLHTFFNTFNPRKYSRIYRQNWECQKNFNTYLKNNNSPYLFDKLPRIGMNAIYNLLNNKKKVYIFGFSLQESCKTFYSNKEPGGCHNLSKEVKILKWLHKEGHVDATLCMLQDIEIPTLDCSELKPTEDIISLILEKMNECTLIHCETYRTDNMNVIVNKISDNCYKLFNK